MVERLPVFDEVRIRPDVAGINREPELENTDADE